MFLEQKKLFFKVAFTQVAYSSIFREKYALMLDGTSFKLNETEFPVWFSSMLEQEFKK